MKLKYIFCCVLISAVLLGVRSVDAQEKGVNRCAEYFDNMETVMSECFGGFQEEFTPKKVSAFDITNSKDECAKLDSLVDDYLTPHPELQALIVVYGARINKFGEIEARSNEIINYLTQNKKIERDKIVLIDGGFREKFRIELWTSRSKKVSPPLAPTVDIEKVKFKGKKKDFE